MAGFINPKTNIFDTLYTLEGKRQTADGKMRAEYYSFSDAGAFYLLTDTYASGSQDNLARLNFEVTSLPQDRITFESDDSGKLVVKQLLPYNSNEYSVINGFVFSGSYHGTKDLVTGSDFTNATNEILSSSIDSFKKLYILATEEPFDKRFDEFKIYPKSVQFTITDTNPIPTEDGQGMPVGNIDYIESLFADKRLTHIPNYKFLPPVNKVKLGTNTTTPLGVFAQLEQQPIFEFSDLQTELAEANTNGFSNTVYFTESSRANHIVCQLFELANGQVTKLDVIDFGIFVLTNNEVKQISKEDFDRATAQEKTLTTKHVYFAGKLYTDSRGSHTFVNMFTLIFE